MTTKCARIYKTWSRSVHTDTEMTVSEWADRHRYLTSLSAEPGLWRTDRAPYLRGIMDSLSANSPYRKISVMKGVQLGLTEAGCNWFGYIAHHAPGPAMMVQPTIALAEQISEQRIDKMIDASPTLRSRIRPSREQGANNRKLAKEFPGGAFKFVGANSGSSLRSMPVRYMYMDEVDAYPLSVERDGDPLTVAEARTSTFQTSKKILLTSTPLIKGASLIESEFLKTDQRYYFVPCPHCGHMQVLRFAGFRWEKGRPETVHFVCEACSGKIYERHKTAMLAGGEWRPTATAVDPDTIGFHISSWYSPVGWKSWQQCIAQWLAAQGNPAQMQVAVNLLFAETWSDRGEAPDWERLFERRDPTRQMGTVPVRASLLTAGIDVQDDRLEASVWAWGRNFESWLVDHVVLDGSPGAPAVWAAADDFVLRQWPIEDGRGHMRIAKVGIDSGGHHTQAVYAWVRRQNRAQVAAFKGVDSPGRVQAVTGPSSVDIDVGGKKYKKAVALWMVSVSLLKSELYQWLKTPRPDDDAVDRDGFPRGYIHFPAGAPAEFFRQLCAEELVHSTTRLGRTKMEWRQTGRNEALDCRNYARAALYILGADTYGGSESFWRAAEGAVVAKPKPPDHQKRGAPPSQSAPSWMGNFGSYR